MHGDAGRPHPMADQAQHGDSALSSEPGGHGAIPGPPNLDGQLDPGDPPGRGPGSQLGPRGVDSDRVGQSAAVDDLEPGEAHDQAVPGLDNLHIASPHGSAAGPSCPDETRMSDAESDLHDPDGMEPSSPASPAGGTEIPRPAVAAEAASEDGTDAGGDDDLSQQSPEPWLQPSDAGSPSKGKQKQKSVQFQLSPEPEHSNPTSPGEDSQPLPYHIPKMGEAGWETSADRPPVKLPIRFKDAIGRHFIFPWEKAKTWEGVERLIEASWLHIEEPLRTHVFDGNYDLTADLQVLTTNPSGNLHASSSVPPMPPSPPPAADMSLPGHGKSGSAASSPEVEISHSPLSPQPSSSVPMAPTQIPVPQAIAQVQKSTVIIPSLWEDLVVPGCQVKMNLWPLPTLPPPPLPTFPHPAGRGGGPPPMAHGHNNINNNNNNNWAPPPPPPPRIRVVFKEKPRGKTRKRQDGL